jgi:hypothetical protein
MAHRRLAGAVIAAATLASAFSSSLSARQTARLEDVDRIAIQQLVARYSYALDDAIDDGEMLAGLFLSAGVLATPNQTIAGHDRLVEFARQRKASTGLATIVTNVVLEGAGDRASGRVYVLEINVDATGATDALATGGVFLDDYVKTPLGWRFARREFVRSRLPQEP